MQIFILNFLEAKNYSKLKQTKNENKNLPTHSHLQFLKYNQSKKENKTPSRARGRHPLAVGPRPGAGAVGGRRRPSGMTATDGGDGSERWGGGRRRKREWRVSGNERASSFLLLLQFGLVGRFRFESVPNRNLTTCFFPSQKENRN